MYACVCICIYIYTCVYGHIYIYIYMYMYMYMCVCCFCFFGVSTPLPSGSQYPHQSKITCPYRIPRCSLNLSKCSSIHALHCHAAHLPSCRDLQGEPCFLSASVSHSLSSQQLCKVIAFGIFFKSFWPLFCLLLGSRYSLPGRSGS